MTLRICLVRQHETAHEYSCSQPTTADSFSFHSCKTQDLAISAAHSLKRCNEHLTQALAVHPAFRCILAKLKTWPSVPLTCLNRRNELLTKVLAVHPRRIQNVHVEQVEFPKSHKCNQCAYQQAAIALRSSASQGTCGCPRCRWRANAGRRARAAEAPAPLLPWRPAK